MNIVRPTSLAATLDATAEALFFQKPTPSSLCTDIAAMLINRQIQSGSNSGFFLPFAAESGNHSRLFSGEPINTEFARRHIQLIEAARLLNLLALSDIAVRKSIQTADRRMNTMCYSNFCSKGECKSITIAYMRYLVSSDSKDAGIRINSFLTRLTSYRDGKGKWGGFPFYYTMLMLSDVTDPLATQELQYAALSFDKQMAHNESPDPYSRRRQAILTKVLARR